MRIILAMLRSFLTEFENIVSEGPTGILEGVDPREISGFGATIVSIGRCIIHIQGLFTVDGSDTLNSNLLNTTGRYFFIPSQPPSGSRVDPGADAPV